MSSTRAGHITPGTEILLAGTWHRIARTIARRTGIILITTDGTRVPMSLYTELTTR